MPSRPKTHRPQGPRRNISKLTDSQRGSSDERGYDRDWRRLRAAFLMQHPLCQCDDCDDGRIKITAAEVVDHIKTIRQAPELRLAWNNLRSMAKRCHDRHTARTVGYGRSGH